MLQLIFKNGTIRNINVVPAFFLSEKTGDKLSKAVLTDKVTDIASDLGVYRTLFHATLYAGTQLLVEVGPNLHNRPFDYPEEDKIDYSEQVKNMKKDSKGFRFTQRILRNSDGVFVTPIDEKA